ncbi:hypothetical protein B0H14DRAFT_2581385 [Mycena olivaceomarginata]|nr:hypothetical protein B0H14DRAFT_2581385 [Mycena olivaceomarginata]
MACTGGRIPQDSTHLPNALRRVREGTCGTCTREHGNGDFSWRLESDIRTRHVHCGGGNMTVEQTLLYSLFHRAMAAIYIGNWWALGGGLKSGVEVGDDGGRKREQDSVRVIPYFR